MKVKVRAAATHVCVFGHGVQLEEERALDDLTHLIDAEWIYFFNIEKKTNKINRPNADIH